MLVKLTIGLSHRGDFKCNVSVESLIVTNNGLRTITPGALASLHKLKVLDFSRNEVGVLVEDAFKGLAQLEKLDASHNRLAALPPKIFRFDSIKKTEKTSRVKPTKLFSLFSNLNCYN